MFPPLKGASWNNDRLGTGRTPRFAASCSSLTQSNLQQTLKDGPVRHGIEDLLGMRSNYHEAITIVQQRYNRPRLLHQAQVHAVVEHLL